MKNFKNVSYLVQKIQSKAKRQPTDIAVPVQESKQNPIGVEGTEFCRSKHKPNQ